MTTLTHYELINLDEEIEHEHTAAPCPFCGSERVEFTTVQFGFVPRRAVCCVTCDARGPAKREYAQAVAGWNAVDRCLSVTPAPVATPETLPRWVCVVKSEPEWWYAEHIGEVFEVTGKSPDGDRWDYVVKNHTGHVNWIAVDDCIRVDTPITEVPATEPAPCYDGGACRNADQLATFQARLKLADDLVREFVIDLRVLTPQQREVWEKWTGK